MLTFFAIYTIIYIMKKRYLCSVIVSIMIIATFSAGCVTDGTNPIVISTEKQELFDKALNIINNPTEILQTAEKPISKITFEEPNKFTIYHKTDPYWHKEFLVDESEISYIKNGVHVSTKQGEFFFVKDSSLTDIMYYTVYERHEVNPNYAKQKQIAYIILLNEECYNTVTAELKAHM